MKFKGKIVKGKQQNYTLKQQLSQGGFSMIYSTNISEIICKVQVLSIPEILASYQRQKEILKTVSHFNMVRLYESIQMTEKGQKYGLLMLQNCSCGTVFDCLQQYQGKFMPEKLVVSICSAVVNLLEHLHSKGISHRDIKMENILKNNKGEYKICDFGSSSKNIITNIDQSNRTNIQELIQKTTTPLYRSPQQLDLYSGFQIGPKTDIFALGVLAFMLCFQKPPFEGGLAAISKQYFIPQQHNYSPVLINLIEDCFITDPNQRPTAKQIKQKLSFIANLKKIQLEINYQKQLCQTQSQISSITEQSLKSNGQIAEQSFFQKIKLVYSQITTQTEGWIVGFIQDNQQFPPLKYNRFIIKKCWQKRYKIQKFFEILWNASEQNKQKCLVTIKLLTLVHNFLRKGPKQAITYEKDKSVIKLCAKIYKNWKNDQKILNAQDVKRNPFMCILIRYYSLLIMQKLKFCYENSHLLEGNYSIAPYLMNPQNKIILQIPLIESMLTFLQNCAKFHEQIQKRTYLIDIQRALIFSMVDEEYCLISTLIFIFCAFKRAICYVKYDLDMQSLNKKVKELDHRFSTVFNQLSKLFTQAQKFASLFQQNKFQLKPDVLTYVLNINISEKKNGNFKIADHLNYQKQFFGIKIPFTYQQVVNNPNFLKDLQKIKYDEQKYIQVNQYKLQENKSKYKNKQIQNQEKHKIKTQKPIKQEIKNKDQTDKNQGTRKNKQEVFESFVFEKTKKQNEYTKNSQINKSMHMIQFTHQNLNKDFNSSKSEQFKNFMSIVNANFENQTLQNDQNKEKITSNINQKKQQPKYKEQQQQMLSAQKIPKNNNNNSSNPIDKISVNKIELMNFFDDDDEEDNNQNKSKTKNDKEIQIIENDSKLHEKNQKEQNPKVSILNSNNNNDNHILGLQSVKFQNKNHTPVTINQNQKSKIEVAPTKQKLFGEDKFIDLKGFVVQQVKKNAQQYIIDFKTLKFKEKVGYGHSSEVYKGEWRGRQIAIKKIKDGRNLSHSQKQFKRQIMTSVRIRHHPQLVTLIGVAQDAKYYYLISEFCNGSTLFDLLHQSSLQLNWKTRINITNQIARGMLFLHTNEPPIIHRDLKSLNLLTNKYDVNNPENISIKIADFGLSRDFASTYMTGALGTYHWMAPEIFNNQEYSLKADIYSFAIVLWEIAARVPPYLNMKNTQSLMKFITIQNGRPDMTFIPHQCPIEFKKLMIQCWDKFPSNRPDFHQILKILQNIELSL